MAQWVKGPTSAQVMTSQFVSSSSVLGSVLTAQNLDPALDSVSVSVSLSAPPLLTLSLSKHEHNTHTHLTVLCVLCVSLTKMKVPQGQGSWCVSGP